MKLNHLLPFLFTSVLAQSDQSDDDYDDVDYSYYGTGLYNDTSLLFTAYIGHYNWVPATEDGNWLLSSIEFDAGDDTGDWDAKSAVGYFYHHTDEYLTFETNYKNDGSSTVLTLNKPVSLAEEDALIIYQFNEITQKADNYYADITLTFVKEGDTSETYEIDYDSVTAYRVEGDIFHDFDTYTSLYGSTLHYSDYYTGMTDLDDLTVIDGTVTEIPSLSRSGTSSRTSSNSASSSVASSSGSISSSTPASSSSVTSSSSAVDTTVDTTVTTSTTSSTEPSTTASSTTSSAGLAVVGKAVGGSAVLTLVSSILFFLL